MQPGQLHSPLAQAPRSGAGTGGIGNVTVAEGAVTQAGFHPFRRHCSYIPSSGTWTRVGAVVVVGAGAVTVTVGAGTGGAVVVDGVMLVSRAVNSFH